ncbi:MAG: hypothetical protein ACAH80_10570 [Alphaproteobacteria bacterium]
MTDKNGQDKKKANRLLSGWLRFLGWGWLLLLGVVVVPMAAMLILGWAGFLD